MKRPSAIAKRRDSDAILKLMHGVSLALAHGPGKISEKDKAWLLELSKLFRDAHRFITRTSAFARLPQTNKRSERRAYFAQMKAVHWTRNLPSKKWPEIPLRAFAQFEEVVCRLLKGEEPDTFNLASLRTFMRLIEQKAREERK